MNQEYSENGFVAIRDVFSQSELLELSAVLSDFHESWKEKNHSFYKDSAVNSAYITGKEHLTENPRTKLFQFIGSKKIMDAVKTLMPGRPCFMNTQLFFDPVNKAQKNYWHRDPQYHMTVEEQKRALAGPAVIHFRIPLKNERGIELVPGTHKRWDTEDEQNVRLETNNRKNHEDLETGLAIDFKAGDMLIFSANMIHRGLYGNDRLSLDILFCDTDPNIAQFVQDDCLPSIDILDKINDATAFKNRIDLKTSVSDN